MREVMAAVGIVVVFLGLIWLFSEADATREIRFQSYDFSRGV